MGSLSIPFHFATTFLVTIAALGGLWVAIARPAFAPPTKWFRRLFAGGWGLLALAEILHGTLIAVTDSDSTVWALRSGAYALIVFSLLPPESKGKKAGAAVVGGTTAALMPTFLSGAAAFYAYRYPAPAARRLGIAFGLFAGSEFLLGFAGHEAVTGLTAVSFAAHGLRFFGALAVGGWLRRVVRDSVQMRFVSVFVALLLIAVVALSSVMTALFTQNITSQALSRAAREGAFQQEQLDARRKDAVTNATTLADLDFIRNAVVMRDPPTMANLVRGLQQPSKPYDRFDFISLLDPQGAILAASAGSEAAPKLTSEDQIALPGTSVVQATITQGQPVASLDVLGGGRVVVVGAAPIFNAPGVDPPGAPRSIAGVLVLGNVVDSGYLGSFARSGEQAFIIDQSRQLATTMPGDTSDLLKIEPRRVRERVFVSGSLLTVSGDIGGQPFVNSFVPLKKADGEVIAALVLSQPADVLGQLQRNIGRTLFLLTLLATAVAVGASYYSGSRITKPIRELTVAAGRVAEGELDVAVSAPGNDEVSRLATAFGSMTASLSGLTGDLRQAATQEHGLRSQLETILQSMADGVVAIDVECGIVAFNREAERIFGHEASAVMGAAISTVVHVFDQSGNEIELPIVKLSEGSVTGSVGKGARKIPVSITSAPIRDSEGQLAGGVAVVRDMTREIQVERMKTEFLSNISHELRTPLTPIKAYSDMLRRRDIPRKKAIGFLDSVISSADRLERIVEMLVDFSAMEAGRLAIRKVPLDVNQVTSELITKWSRNAPKHKFERKGFTKLPKVSLDKRLFPLAIGELLDNAVKFSPKGGKVTLTAETDAQRNGSGALHITVADQGIGISRSELSRIRQDFVQADGSETRAFGGLGLGLGYVGRIVVGHGGKLEIDSTPGKGSRFTLVFPLSASPEVKLHPRSTKGARRPIKVKRVR